MPIKAIVKTYIDSSTPFTGSMVRPMIRNLKKIHRLGITVRDIKEDAYLDGILVDMSKAWTVPHPCYDLERGLFRPTLARNETECDLDAFQDIIDDWNRENPDDHITARAWVDVDRVVSLRESSYLTSGILLDPAKHNWRKWQRPQRALRSSKQPTSTQPSNGISKRKGKRKTRKTAK